MRITNTTGLPDAIVAAVRNDSYDPGDCDISVTQLIGPPQIRHLRQLHDNEIEEDASGRIWALLGQAIHTILERASGVGIAEERLYGTLGDHRIGGQVDSLGYETHRLTDYKVTSAWTYVHQGIRPDWISQLNCYAWLARANGLQVDELEVVALYRDWSTTQSLRSKDYPQAQVGRLKVPLWPEDMLTDYISTRLKMHFTPPLPPCSDQERWAKAEKWAVMKKGRKSALRVLGSRTEAIDWAMEKGHIAEYITLGDTGEAIDWKFSQGYYLQERPREFVRCQRYCSVAPFCEQWLECQIKRDFGGG